MRKIEKPLIPAGEVFLIKGEPVQPFRRGDSRVHRGRAKRMDWVDAAWRLREIEMDERQREREKYVRRYNPIRTLDGLDPHPQRAPLRILRGIIRSADRALNG